MAAYQDIDGLTDVRATTLAFSDSDSDNILNLFPSASSTLASDHVSDTAAFLSQRLQYLSMKETRSRLHGSTLSQYWRNKRIPRGLRINKEPALGRNNSEFCKQWCEILNKCSFDLMLLVIKHADAELSKTRSEITDLKKETSGKLSTQQLHDIETECAAMNEKYEKQISDMKLNKYRRDTLDYKNDRVYPWLSLEGSRPHYRHQDRREGYQRRREGHTASSGWSTDESGNEERAPGPRQQPFLGHPMQRRRPPRATTGGVQPGGAASATARGSRGRGSRKGLT